MARLRHKDEWFIEIDPLAFFETEFEGVILQNVHLLHPDAILLPFKQTVFSSEYESKKPDLALIDRDYRFWWVIEVELASHSLSSHVIPQTRVLVDGRYGDEHISALLRASPELDRDRLESMMRGEPPRVVVISNRYDPRWDRELAAIGVAYSVFNVFRSTLNNDIFLFDGSLPQEAGHHVSIITPAKGIPRFFRVHSPGALPVQPGEIVGMLVDDRQTTWRRIDIKNECYLAIEGRATISADRPYVIERHESGMLVLKEGGVTK
jgi:hypothetical protein